MQIFYKAILVICVVLLNACTQKPSAETSSSSTSPNIVLTGKDDETRIISIQSETQCSLIVKHGRRIENTITPKSCQLTKSADGFISSVLVTFDTPCKQYAFKNVIGTRYFLDEKTIASKNPACVLETFNASYSWEILEAG